MTTGAGQAVEEPAPASRRPQPAATGQPTPRVAERRLLSRSNVAPNDRIELSNEGTAELFASTNREIFPQQTTRSIYNNNNNNKPQQETQDQYIYTSKTTTYSQDQRDNRQHLGEAALDDNKRKQYSKQEDQQPEEEEVEHELLSEALLDIASAEEYAAKILKIQQACLTPLKEDLADWLNKVMNTSAITRENFMDKLDNGVIICRMAKIISLWCYQQFQEQQSNLQTDDNHQDNNQTRVPQQNIYPKQIHSNNKNNNNNNHHNQSSFAKKSRVMGGLLSISTSDVHNPSSISKATTKVDPTERQYYYSPCNNSNSSTSNNKSAISSIFATPLRQPQVRASKLISNGFGPLKAASQSTINSLNVSSTNLNSFSGNNYLLNQFLNNLVRIEQTKIWEEAKCRTFYARDNVSNFIRWSKEFGVNQSVLFESDDLVLHANTRQVVLCLLDVARIACVKYGFTEAPGLVKFEQEINRELAAEKAAAVEHHVRNSKDYSTASGLSMTDNNSHSGTSSDISKQQITPSSGEMAKRKLSSLSKNSRKGSGSAIANATDDLIMRYCIHKEEEAAKKKAAAAAAAAAELEAANLMKLRQLDADSLTAEPTIEDSQHNSSALDLPNNANEPSSDAANRQATALVDLDSLTPTTNGVERDASSSSSLLLKSPSADSSTSVQSRHNLTYDNRVDSLDSGEGGTESASTSHSRTPVNHHDDGSCGGTPQNGQQSSIPTATSATPAQPTTMARNGASSIPRPIKKSTSSSSLISNPTSSIGTSELSSSRSSLFSAQDNSNSTTKRHISSDLDGKVMRIAKSYYGKGAKKGITRLSEGKYKIADRIVFVRLLKGHRVMVRIGGGWDTLENFLFRHKSDPSQVIDVDNLLPLETKMATFEKSPQLTPNHSKSYS